MNKKQIDLIAKALIYNIAKQTDIFAFLDSVLTDDESLRVINRMNEICDEKIEKIGIDSASTAEIVDIVLRRNHD